MIRNLLIFCCLLCFLPSAKADNLAPCSPNCDPFLGPHLSVDLVVPATAFHNWPGGPDDYLNIPNGLFQIGYYSTPALDDLSIFSVMVEAWQSSSAHNAFPIRHARFLTALQWADYENGDPLWHKGDGGYMFYGDDPIPNPEPGTWLLMATGVFGLGFFAKRRHLFSTKIPSK